MNIRTFFLLAGAASLTACTMGLPTKSPYVPRTSVNNIDQGSMVVSIEASNPKELVKRVREKASEKDSEISFISNEQLRSSMKSIPQGPVEELSPTRQFFRQCSRYLYPVDSSPFTFRTCKLQERLNGNDSQWFVLEVLRLE